MIFTSQLIGMLIAELVENGDLPVSLEMVHKFKTDIRGFYIYEDPEFRTRTLMIEPVDH